ncbi:hypothetical protein K439DRAFT_1620247 [Ramaria rubella]|nr:hypothetical protein K439DRAFT_1620247 [Ramaria rubella]
MIRVIENIYRSQLGCSDEDMEELAVPTFNDRVTNALIRSVQFDQAQDTTMLRCFKPLQPVPGLFHACLNLAWLLHNVHRGAVKDEGSLAYYIVLLDRACLSAGKPNYHTLVSHFDMILEGHLLHYWEAECGHASLQKFVDSSPGPGDLIWLAWVIRHKYASTPDVESQDEIFNNGCPLNMDLLTFKELCESCSLGDFRRIEDMLRILMTMFYGGGAKNYTNEMCWLVQNLKNAWTQDFADVVQDNILINLTGHDAHWIGVDLNQEHHIRCLKVIVQSHFLHQGLKADWELVANISPASGVLRALDKQFVLTLGVPYQGMKHTTPGNSFSVMLICNKCAERQVCTMQGNGRKASKVTQDIIAWGA